MKRLALLGVLLVTLAGCAGLTQMVEDKPLLVKTSVQLAAVEYIKFNPKRLVPMEENVNTVKPLVEQGELGTVELVAAKVKELLVADETMLPEERIMANNLVDVFSEEVKQILVAQGYVGTEITAENQKTALMVLDWILDAVQLMK